jgi:putative PEP-CTERM system TPR-repeat lipoprotein
MDIFKGYIMKFIKLLVVIGLINGIVACSESETAESHVNKAKTYINESKFDESIIELKNAIQKSPKNSEARFLLGKLYLQEGSGFEATKELEKADKLKYSKSKVIPLLARAYLVTNSDEDVIALNDQALKLPDEVKSQYLAYNTLANIRIEDSISAKKSALIANESSISTSYSYLASAYILLLENKLDAAKIKVNKALVTSPENPEAIMLLGQINTALGLFSEVSKNYLKYASLQPKSRVIVLLLADAALKEKDYENAERYADSILKNVPNQPFAHYIKSVARFEAQDYKEANVHAEQAELYGFNSSQLKLVAGASSYYLDNFEQSYHHLSAIAQYLPIEHPALKMFAISQLQLGLISDITDTLNNFTVTSKEDAKFLSTLSLQLAEIGAMDDAKALAAKVISKDAENAEDNISRGILKLMLNDPSGMTNFQNALSLKPDSLSAELALVAAALQINDFDKAFKISKEWQEKYPDKPGAFNVLATIYLKQGKLDLAKVSLNKSLNLSAKNHFAISNLINIALKRNELAEANRLSEIGINLFPENEKMLKQYYIVSREDIQKRALATAKIKTLFEAKTDVLSLGLLYSEVLIDQKEYKQAIGIIGSFKPSIRSPKKLWQLNIVAHRYINEGNGVLGIINRWAKTNPYALEPILLLLDQHMRNKEVDSALGLVDKALSGYQKNNVMLTTAKIQILLDSGKLREAKAFYPEFSDNVINKKVVDGIQGRIFLLEKNYAKAEPLLKSFYKDFPSSKNVISLAVAQKGINLASEAISTLEVFLDKNASDNNVRSLLTNYYLESQQNKAIPLYEELLLAKPDNIVFLNNLAWLNLENGNVELALKYSSKAVKLAPEYPNVIDTRAMVLLKAGRKVDAWQAIIKAYGITKGQDPSISLNYAEVLIANDKNQEAMAVLKRIKSKNIEIMNRKEQLSKRVNPKV